MQFVVFAFSPRSVCFPFTKSNICIATADKQSATQFPRQNYKLLLFFLSVSVFFGDLHNKLETFFAHWRPFCLWRLFRLPREHNERKLKENIKVTIDNAIISMINDARARNRGPDWPSKICLLWLMFIGKPFLSWTLTCKCGCCYESCDCQIHKRFTLAIDFRHSDRQTDTC